MSAVHGLLNASVRIARRVETPGELGGIRRSREIVASGVPARIVGRTLAERSQGPEQFAQADVAVYFDPGADVQRGDELEVEPSYARQLEVLGFEDPSVAAYRKALTQERQDARA